MTIVHQPTPPDARAFHEYTIFRHRVIRGVAILENMRDCLANSSDVRDKIIASEISNAIKTIRGE